VPGTRASASGRHPRHPLRRPFVDDPPVVHHHDAIGGRLGEGHLVRNHDHRHAVLSQLAHDLDDLAHHLGVQRARWLVEQHQRGPHRQCSGDRDPLLLASGEL
jgi:hypothetical protein